MYRIIRLLVVATATAAAAGCASPEDVADWQNGEQASALEDQQARDEQAALAEPEEGGSDDGGEVQASAAGGGWDAWASGVIVVGGTDFVICYDGDCGPGVWTGPGTGDDGSDDNGGGGGGGGGDDDGDGGDGGSGDEDDRIRRIPKVSPPVGWQNRELTPLDVLDCFETAHNEGMTHSMTIYVKQPETGSSKRFDVASQSFGHVWVGIEQTDAGGQTTRRDVGMHPDTEVQHRDGHYTATPIMLDEPAQLYDVAVTLELTPADFRDVINIFNGPTNDTTRVTGPTYHIEHNNNVDFALMLLTQTTHSLPITQPSLGAFRGPDPGRVGYDFTQMALQPGMSRTLGGVSPGSASACGAQQMANPQDEMRR